MRMNSPSRISELRLQSELVDDFFSYTNGQLWTKVDGDSGASVAIDADGTGGLVALVTGATDNNEAYLHSTNELFAFAASRPIEFEAGIQFAEASTDDANVLVGLMDAVAANALQDNGAGPKASYSGAVFFKADGDTLWSVETSVGGTQTTTQTKTTAGSSSQQRLRIEINPTGGSAAQVTFWANGQQCVDSDGKLIRHEVSFGSATEMSAVLGLKAGGANSETLTVDYVGASQAR